jgi:hypothetical protein
MQLAIKVILMECFPIYGHGPLGVPIHGVDTNIAYYTLLW